MEGVSLRAVGGVARLFLARRAEGAGGPFEFADTVEPGIPKERKWVIQVAVQAGCPVGCSLCDAGAYGFSGNLSAQQMLAQVRHVLAANPSLDARRHPKLKVQFTRMGEPTLNPAVLEALRLLREEIGGPGLVAGLSTVAPQTPPAEAFLERLREVKDRFYANGRFQLQFSLHATDEAARARIVPVRSWGFDRMADYGRWFRRDGDRKVTLNFALPPGASADAAAIARRFDPDDFLVKLGPIRPTFASRRARQANPWREIPPRLARFADELRASGFHVLVAPALAERAAPATACGQLWSPLMRRGARVRQVNLRRETEAYARSADISMQAQRWLAALPGRAAAMPRLGAWALLVVGLREARFDPRASAYLPAARAVAHNVARLAAAFRRGELPVGFLGEAAPFLLRRPQEPAFSGAPAGPEREGWLRRWLAEDTASLIVCGARTHAEVEAAACQARESGLRVIVPVDACADMDEAAHLAGLRRAAARSIFVATTEEVLRSLCPKSC